MLQKSDVKLTARTRMSSDMEQRQLMKTHETAMGKQESMMA